MLRFEMAPTLRRWDALKRGLYIKPSRQVSDDAFISWLMTKSDESQKICRAFSELMNGEFHRAWGEPGIAGNDIDIVHTCRLFAEMCESALQWEEDVRFVRAHDALDEVLSLYTGVVGAMIDEAAKLPIFLRDNFDGSVQPGVYRLSLTLTLPDDWSERVSAALQSARHVFA